MTRRLRSGRPGNSAFLALLQALLVLFFCLQAFAAGQDLPSLRPLVGPPPGKVDYTLTEAVNTALKSFPSLRYAHAKVRSTDAGITLARTAYLPNFDVMMEEMQTTRNVIAGTILPQAIDVIPTQTGQPRKSSNFASVWSNSLGANFSWELYDFGLRHANVLLARAERATALANVKLTELDVAASAAESYLETVANQQTIRAQKATVARMQAWALIVHTLVDKGLRAGVDAARADSDVAFARIALIEAERDTDLARVDLSEAMGIAGVYVGVLPAPLVVRPPKIFNAGPIEVVNHPLAVVRAAQVETAAATVHAWDRTWYPKIWLHSAIWGRGSGVKGDDARPVWDGVLPQSGNWAAGLTLSFPFFDIFEIRAHRRIALRNEEADRASYDLAIQILTQKDARARVLLENARRIADETTVLIKAAKENEMKALERYKVGLTDIVEVAEAERILARAEVEDAVAEVRVWRAILASAYAQGDLRPFINLVALAEARSQ